MPDTALPAIPPAYGRTRTALHRVAERVVAPARTRATGNEIALEPRPGGFGTPAFPDGGWVAVDGVRLLRAVPGTPVAAQPLTTLAAAAAFAGDDGPAAGADDTPLEVDAGAAAVLAAVFAFAGELLGALRADAAGDASPIRLWPEHFDLAYEEGDEAAGRRAGYGVSPGDDEHTEPYVYVAPWAPPPPGPLWNATAFRGAELGWEDLRAVGDPHAHALAFLRERRDALRTGGEGAGA